MTVTIILHCIDREEVLYEGPARDCLPIPQVGSEIECDKKVYRLEGLRYQYEPDRLTVHLLA